MLKYRLITFVGLAILLCLVANPVAGRGTKLEVTRADYARAENWLRHSVAEKVLNKFVTPHWINGSDEFWYRMELRDGHQFMLVDASTGSRASAFDHQAIATELTRLTGKSTTAKQLPFTFFEYGDDARESIIFSLSSTDYICTFRRPGCVLTDNRSPGGVLLSPDGKVGILTRDGNLFLSEQETGKESRLTHDGQENYGYGIYYDGWQGQHIARTQSVIPPKPMAAQWSPDANWVLVPRVDQRHVKYYPLLDTVPGDGSFRPKLFNLRLPLGGEEPATLEWFVFNIGAKTSVRVDLPYTELLHLNADLSAVQQFFWNTEHARVYATAFDKFRESAYLFEIDLNSGGTRKIFGEKSLPRMDLSSSPYNPPNVYVTAAGKEVIWWSQRDGWGHLYLYDGETGAFKNRITRGNWLVRDLVHVDEQKRIIFFTASGAMPGNPYYRYLYRVNFDGSELVLLSPENADHMITQQPRARNFLQAYRLVSPSGNYVVYNQSTVQKPTETVIRRVKDGSLVAVVERADASALYAAGWQNPKEFSVKAADGITDLYGVIYMPVNLQKNRKYPVIDSQYASPLTAVVPHNFLMAMNGVPGKIRQASLAELGFASVAVDARGTAFRSADFQMYSWQKLHTMGLEDHIAAIEQLADRFAWIDKDRVGIHGSSFGGWTTFRAMFEFPSFFKAGISSTGMGGVYTMPPDYHWFSYHGKLRYADGTDKRAFTGDKPVNYLNADNEIQAVNLQGKLLIMMGGLDENVLPGSTMSVIDALIKADKDFELLYLPGESHRFINPHTVRRSWDFFVRHLHDVKPPSGYHIKPF